MAKRIPPEVLERRISWLDLRLHELEADHRRRAMRSNELLARLDGAESAVRRWEFEHPDGEPKGSDLGTTLFSLQQTARSLRYRWLAAQRGLGRLEQAIECLQQKRAHHQIILDSYPPHQALREVLP